MTIRARSARLHPTLEAANNLLLIPLATIMLLELVIAGRAEVLPSVERLTLLIAASFLFEWVVGLLAADQRRDYLLAPTKILDLVSSIPFGVAFQSVRLIRLARLVRVVRMAQRAARYRGRRKRIVRALGLVGSTMLAATIAVQLVEPATFPSFADALWWTVVTMSTVGYGDVLPQTVAGRLVGGVVIFFGVGVFGYIAGFAASILDDDDEREHLRALQRIEAKLDVLMARRSEAEASDSPPDALGVS